jgi:uncharacterized SAM-binding protein YcdF (DUF218 family)
MKFRNILLSAASLLIIAISIIIFRNAGKYLLKKDEAVTADAIVILMGSIADRSLQTADLFNKGMIEWVIFVEADMGSYYQKLFEKGVPIVNNTEQMRDSLVALGIPPDSIIILPGKASSTLMEACIVRDYLRRNHNIDTLIVVSSNYHTRRASMIFKSVLKGKEHPVNVSVYPSTYSEFDPKKWWRNRKEIKIVISEYVKMFAFLAFDKWRACKD